MCEDYRAGAYADYEIDKADLDAGKKITVPMLALWGDAGVASAATTPLDYLEEMGHECGGGAGGFRAFPAGGEPGGDGEVACGSFFWRSDPTRHAREGGHPVRRGLSINRDCLWNTGSPPSRG
jgi:hypothetical protein